MEIEKETMVDRGKGTMVDEVPDTAFMSVCNSYWEMNSEVNMRINCRVA